MMPSIKTKNSFRHAHFVRSFRRFGWWVWFVHTINRIYSIRIWESAKLKWIIHRMFFGLNIISHSIWVRIMWLLRIIFGYYSRCRVQNIVCVCDSHTQFNQYWCGRCLWCDACISRMAIIPLNGQWCQHSIKSKSKRSRMQCTMYAFEVREKKNIFWIDGIFIIPLKLYPSPHVKWSEQTTNQYTHRSAFCRCQPPFITEAHTRAREPNPMPNMLIVHTVRS